jgi:hypothetical protein
MARGAHGSLKFHPGLPCLTLLCTPCGRATPETAHLQGRWLLAVFYPFGLPTPYAYYDDLHYPPALESRIYPDVSGYRYIRIYTDISWMYPDIQGRMATVAIVANFGNCHTLQGNWLSFAGQFQNFIRTFVGQFHSHIFKIPTGQFQ